MFFLLLATTITVLAALVLRWRGQLMIRTASRIGIGAAFLFTGVDHFLSLEARYVPMLPNFLSRWAVELVLISGAMEVAAALGLLLPRAAWRSFGLPNLRPFAGVGLAMLLSVVVLANGHMAEVGIGTQGLPTSQSYLVLRVFLQPFIVLWVLVASEAVFPPVSMPPSSMELDIA